MRKLRYYIRLFFAFLKRFKALIVIGIIFGVFLFLSSSVLLQKYSNHSKEVIGINGRYQTNNLPVSIQSFISKGLTTIDESGSLKPGIASDWETSDNGKTWIFHIDDSIKWHSGEAVTSNSITYEFTDVVVERPDNNTLVFKLENPFIPFPSVVSRPIFKKGLIGVADWKVENVSLVGTYIQELVLVNENKDIKVFKFYPTVERTKLAFKLGEVDQLMDLFDQNPFQSWKTVSVESVVNQNQVVTLFYNTGDPVLSEKTYRQALAYAIDKRLWGEERAISPVAPDSWAYNAQVKQYVYDPERAKELLKDMAQEQKKALPIKLVSTPLLLPLAEQIADDWKQVGIDTIVQVSSIVPTEFQAYLTIFDIPKDPDQYSMWHSKQIETNTNISRFSSPRIDKLLEDGRTQINFDERKKLYLDFQRFLLEDLPAVFLYHPKYYTIKRK